MNIYNICKNMLVIIVAAIVVAGPLSAKRESPKLQLYRCRQQLAQYKQQYSLLIRQIAQNRRQLAQAKPYRLLAMGLINLNMPKNEIVEEVSDYENDSD